MVLCRPEINNLCNLNYTATYFLKFATSSMVGIDNCAVMLHSCEIQEAW